MGTELNAPSPCTYDCSWRWLHQTKTMENMYIQRRFPIPYQSHGYRIPGKVPSRTPPLCQTGRTSNHSPAQENTIFQKLGCLRQTALPKSRCCRRIPRQVHPSGSHLQPPNKIHRQRKSILLLQRLRTRGSHQNHDTRRWRVPQTVLLTYSTSNVCQNQALWLPLQKKQRRTQSFPARTGHQLNRCSKRKTWRPTLFPGRVQHLHLPLLPQGNTHHHPLLRRKRTSANHQQQTQSICKNLKKQLIRAMGNHLLKDIQKLKKQ